MSFIPASAMPHAKPHEHGDDHAHDGSPKPETQPPSQSPAAAKQGHTTPWGAALAISGALAIGAAATAFVLSRRGKPDKKPGSRKGGRKSGGKKNDQ